MKVALDMMGGDEGEKASVLGLRHYAANNNCDDVEFVLFGDKSKIENILKSAAANFAFNIYDTGTNVVTNDEKPASVIKKGRGTSMFEAIAHVAKKKADAVVSSGNTGAYMALSKMLIGTINGIDRPAIVSMIPNLKNKTVMLDLGANTDCSSIKLVQFALMGQAVAKVLLKIDKPKVGLLNIGTERSKGTEPLEKAYDLLKQEENIDFIGFVEGTDITNGVVDVIVTDGFSGNISLKTMEGTIKYIMHILKQGFDSTIVGKLRYLACGSVFRSLKTAIDPRNHNGAPLVGLKEIVIKSHGHSDYIGFAHAISVAIEFAKSDFVIDIERMIANTNEVAA
ncbi:MAG: phosphate acyltransferase PlsX [Holosporales bacterium]|jgi:glycerol-3-phosphate acyltransferase PlsX|nr:phosphate acyltransferase PlsX [Holosporales bacterium]